MTLNPYSKRDFIVGLDLGQSSDYTALAVLEVVPQFAMEQVERREGAMTYRRQVRVEKPAHLHCRHLERYPLGTLYPAIVDQVAALLQTPQLRGAELVVDATGVGRPVVDMLREAGLKLEAVTITGGISVTYSDRCWHVPKRDLVGAVQAPLHDKRLKFADGLPLVPTLVQEMLNFQVKISDAAHDSYGSWREGAHDDLILSVMLAAWWAAKRPKEYPPPQSYSFGPQYGMLPVYRR